MRRLLIWAAFAVIITPPALVAYKLYRAAAQGDCEPGSIDDDICDNCDGLLDDDGNCWGCGGWR